MGGRDQAGSDCLHRRGPLHQGGNGWGPLGRPRGEKQRDGGRHPILPVRTQEGRLFQVASPRQGAHGYIGPTGGLLMCLRYNLNISNLNIFGIQLNIMNIITECKKGTLKNYPRLRRALH